MKTLSVLFVSMLVTVSIASEIITTPWEMAIELTGDRFRSELVLGTHEQGTDSFDINLDGLAPPPAPGGIYSYLRGKGIFSAMTKDIRPNSDTLIVWEVVVSGMYNDTVSVKWDASHIPQSDIKAELVMSDSINMLVDSSLVITQNTTLNITYRPAEQILTKQYLIRTKPNALPFYVDGQRYDESALFEWKLNSQHILEAADSLVFDFCKQYRFVSWNQESSPSLNVTVSDSDSVYCAVYDSLYFISTAVQPPGAGVVQPFPPGKWVNAGHPVILVAEADSGYQFDRWTTHMLSNPDSVIVDSCYHYIANFTAIPSTVAKKGKTAFHDYQLWPAFPNPFNRSTQIRFSVPGSTSVRVAIYNQLGEMIDLLYHGETDTGLHNLYWQGRDSNGKPVASGLYFVVMTAGRFMQTQKLIVIL